MLTKKDVLMRFFKGVLILSVLSAFWASVVSAEEYWIKVDVVKVEGFTVTAQIETNLPGRMQLLSRLLLKELPKSGDFIGTGPVRVPLSNGKTTMTIDGQKRAIPHGFLLPEGVYELEVVFIHLWPSNTRVTQATGLSSNIRTVTEVKLSNTQNGDVSVNQNKSADGVRWVIENVYQGYAWDPMFWQNKFGDIVQLEYLGLGDTDLFEVYYVKSINMSLIVDVQKNIILKYSVGVANK